VRRSPGTRWKDRTSVCLMVGWPQAVREARDDKEEEEDFHLILPSLRVELPLLRIPPLGHGPSGPEENAQVFPHTSG